jgi:hypothetical protein
LMTSLLSGPFVRLGLSTLWAGLHGPTPNDGLFQTGFHLLVGIMMALFYAFVLEPLLPSSPAFKGWLYALVVWIANAAIILPLTGEGFAGSTNLTVAGMAWFAGCHALFFLVLAYGFAALMHDAGPAK